MARTSLALAPLLLRYASPFSMGVKQRPQHDGGSSCCSSSEGDAFPGMAAMLATCAGEQGATMQGLSVRNCDAALSQHGFQPSYPTASEWRAGRAQSAQNSRPISPPAPQSTVSSAWMSFSMSWGVL